MDENYTENQASTVEATEEQEETQEPQAPSQDLIKNELEKVKEAKARTEAEKAAFSLKKTAERLKQLGGDPYEILKPEKSEEITEETPLTVGMLKKIQLEEAQKTAISLADSITDESERELVKHHLENTIKPSGNPQQDFSAARAIVNSVKNGQIVEELGRKTMAKSHSSATSAPEKPEDVFTPTEDEDSLMRPPFNLTKEDVIKARQQAQK